MTREEVYKDIEEMFGLVPSFLKLLPDNTLELEWKLMKAVQFEEGPIPNKYRELIGLGIAATSKCRYCTLFHTHVAKMLGATDEEIHEVLRYAGNSALWSAWLNGNQVDYDEFADELRRVGEFMMAKADKAPLEKAAI